MQATVNRLRGQVRLKVEGAYPERFLNICAANGLPFWGVEYQSETCLHVSMTRTHYRRLGPYADRAMCTATPLRQTGLPYFLGRFRRRYMFMTGAALCLLSLLFFSRFIIDIRVTGNETVTSGKILTALKDAGFHPGVYGPVVNTNILAHQVLLSLPELSYCTVNITGCRATVVVRERIPKPEIINPKAPTNVIAEKAGVITRMETLEGTPKVMVGSTVLPGELLISGVDDIESATGDGSSAGTRMLHAMGNVYAKTYYKRTAKMPLTACSKQYTGEKKRRVSLLFGRRRINFLSNGRIPYDNYDRMKKINWLTLPFGLTFPIGLETETITAYTLQEQETDPVQAETYLRARLLEEVQAELDGGTLLHHSFESAVSGGVLTVTLLCECEEQIGAVVELPTEEQPEPAD